ncbi:uncharacterized protein LOC142939172 [Anarhichas minor]|uniref:uncharacterized protein LOC142939172 n=1 Tax=Anarhichas minor TaxID=65739 RepID=UPI003F733398
MNICSCLLALVLGWNATAEIIHETVEVKTSVSLRCPHSVGTVTWSRESNGSKVDILTVEVDEEIKHIHDPQKRYSSLADKSLYIGRVTVSDSGRYFCNSEAAVELTVIPPGTTRLHATEGTRVTLTCPPDGGSDIKIWSSRNIDEIKHQSGFYASPVNQTLTITYVELKHSGLYYCDGKPAAYLIVTKGQTTTSTITPKTRPTATSVPSTTPLTNEDTTSTTKRHKKKDRKNKNKGNNATTSSTTTTKGTTSTTATTLATGSNTRRTI